MAPARFVLQCLCPKAMSEIRFEPSQIEEKKTAVLKEGLALCDCEPGKTKYLTWVKTWDEPQKVALIPGPVKAEPKSPPQTA